MRSSAVEGDQKVCAQAHHGSTRRLSRTEGRLIGFGARTGNETRQQPRILANRFADLNAFQGKTCRVNHRL